MKVFKFGGASVKHAEAVRNVCRIVQRYPGESLVVVVSAMGKTTNALEAVVRSVQERDGKHPELLQQVKDFHANLLEELFGTVPADLQARCSLIWRSVEERLEKPTRDQPDWFYDQVVSAGEWISTTVVSAYLEAQGVPAQWVDARMLIRTDYTFREGKVDWVRTAAQVRTELLPFFEAHPGRVAVTQGFVGAADPLNTTTLGREGSDYSAAVLAHVVDASEVIIWKDVPGLLNADPKHFEETTLLPNVSYKEAIELAYYGASVIHPKTVQPLQNKGIPLWVKSFVHPEASGTCIHEDAAYDALVPSYIFKKEQRLISLATRDFAFIVEENLSDIFNHFAQYGVKINLMQHSAINFSVSVDDRPEKLDPMIEDLRRIYSVRYNRGLELITVRHVTGAIIEELTAGREKLLEQKTRHTYRVLVR